jgi:tubulin polyglutamylase TTLL5
MLFRTPRELAGDSASSLPPSTWKYTVGSQNTVMVERILRANRMTPAEGDTPAVIWQPVLDIRTKVFPPFQRVNHFPHSRQLLGNKAGLASIIQAHPRSRHFRRFFPLTFVLPQDRDRLYDVMRSSPISNYIAKPPNGSCGEGIKIVRFRDFELISRQSVVSEYISPPLCIDGFKFDLRIYVLVTSFAPLHAFVYREGLARFATECYSNYTTDVFSHLTNATLNKRGRNWSKDFKWKLSELLAEIELRFNRNRDRTMNDILDVVSQSLVFVQPAMAPKLTEYRENPFFELFGFDLLIDYNFHIWLLEINTNPSMGSGSSVDNEVKLPLLAQTLSIVGIGDEEPRTIGSEDARNRRSGDGFIRIFPSERTRGLANLCVAPVFVAQPAVVKIDPESITPIQSKLLLLKYLSGMEQSLRNGSLPWKTAERLRTFLVAQGCDSGKVAANTRSVLHNFIMKQRAERVLSKTEATLPVALEKLSADGLKHLLSNSRFMSLRDSQALFD